MKSETSFALIPCYIISYCDRGHSSLSPPYGLLTRYFNCRHPLIRGFLSSQSLARDNPTSFWGPAGYPYTLI
jgi:hypothetical protein